MAVSPFLSLNTKTKKGKKKVKTLFFGLDEITQLGCEILVQKMESYVRWDTSRCLLFSTSFEPWPHSLTFGVKQKPRVWGDQNLLPGYIYHSITCLLPSRGTNHCTLFCQLYSVFSQQALEHVACVLPRDNPFFLIGKQEYIKDSNQRYFLYSFFWRIPHPSIVLILTYVNILYCCFS